MPDYSKSYIFKLYCKDKKVKDTYIGCCANPVYDDPEIPDRRPWLVHLHKSRFVGGKNYEMTLYKFIRDHGGPENWDYELTEFKCSSQLQLLTEKQRIMDILKPTLNSRSYMKSYKENRIKCECGGGYNSTDDRCRRQHQRTKIHTNWLKSQPIGNKLKGSITKHHDCKKCKMIVIFKHKFNRKTYTKQWTESDKRTFEAAMALAKQYQLEYNKLLHSNKEPIVKKGLELKGNIKEYKSNGRTIIQFRHMYKGESVQKRWSVGKKRTLHVAMKLAKEYQVEYNNNLNNISIENLNTII